MTLKELIEEINGQLNDGRIKTEDELYFLTKQVAGYMLHKLGNVPDFELDRTGKIILTTLN